MVVKKLNKEQFRRIFQCFSITFRYSQSYSKSKVIKTIKIKTPTCFALISKNPISHLIIVMEMLDIIMWRFYKKSDSQILGSILLCLTGGKDFLVNMRSKFDSLAMEIIHDYGLSV